MGVRVYGCVCMLEGVIGVWVRGVGSTIEEYHVLFLLHAEREREGVGRGGRGWLWLVGSSCSSGREYVVIVA